MGMREPVKFKRIAVGTGIALGLGLLGFALFPWGKDIRNVPIEKTGPVLMFGDSLVEGVGATEGNTLPLLLSKKLQEPVLNYGVSGDTTRKALDRVGPALGENPRLVIIVLGGNDVLQQIPRAETLANLESMIREFQSGGAAVLLMGIRSGILGNGTSGAYWDLAEKTGAAYEMDILQGVFGISALMSDAIHPNTAGYEKIALRLFPVVKGLLESK